MTVRNWIYDRSIHGLTTFSIEDAKKAFPSLSPPHLSNELVDLTNRFVIEAVYRGFYVIVPTHYVLRGAVPPLYYIDQLMAYLGKPYYVSLLNAAELLGAAHQRPQKFSVTTVLPQPRVSSTKNPLLTWTYRREIAEEFLQEKNTETGIVKFSSAELTALDLVQYSKNLGGLSRVATILEELCEVMDMSRFTNSLCQYTTLTTLQRLGYIFECVLYEHEKADVIYDLIKDSGKKMLYIALSKEHSADVPKRNKRWKIIVNTEIETDEI